MNNLRKWKNRKDLKYNTWLVTGYAGFYDDGEDNIKIEVKLDERFTKEDVLNFFFDLFGKEYRSVGLKASIVKEIQNISNIDGKIGVRKPTNSTPPKEPGKREDK